MAKKSNRLPDGIFIGTSGWSYCPWKEYFYPAGLPSSKFLSFYATQFNTAEINSTFYNTSRQTTVEKWLDQVPKNYRFCVKMNRYITHLKKLLEPEQPLERFFTSIAPMVENLGPVLIQLPASLKFDKERCLHFYHLLTHEYGDFTFALEPRHESWFTKESIGMLHKANIAFVISESGLRFPYFEAVTSQHIYIRFHGPGKLYGSPHSEEQLRVYAEKIKAWHKAGHTCWVFFNNTISHDALDNARTLKEYLSI